MVRPHRVFALATFVLFAGALASVALFGRATADPSERQGADTAGHPLAVVLAPDPARTRLIVVDLVTRRVARTISLRSLVTDIDVDSRTGLVVGAQTGGIGPEADDAVSIVDPRSGSVRYVTLPVIDPANVVCVDGRAYVLHSVVTTTGLVASMVDVGSARVVGAGRIPDGPGIWSRAAGSVWSTRVAQDGSWELVRVAPDLRVVARAVRTPLVSGIAESGGRVVLLGGSGTDRRTRGPASVRALGDGGTVIASVEATQLPYPATMAASAAGVLLVGDWGGQERESRRLAAYDAETLQSEGSIVTSGVPCALAPAGDLIVAVDRSRGRLLLLDPVERKVIASIDLGTGGLTCSDVAVVMP